jgi:hypothetical protein
MGKFLQNPLVRTCLVVLFVVLLGDRLPDAFARGFYTLSVLIRDLLMFVLPVAIFTFIAHTLASLKKQAVILVLLLLVFEAFSNALSVAYAYFAGFLMQDFMSLNMAAHQQGPSLEPYFSLSGLRPNFYSVDKGTFLGLGFGLLLALKPMDSLEKVLTSLKSKVDFLFSFFSLYQA